MMNIKTIGLITLLIALLFIAATVLAGVESKRIKMSLSDTCIDHIEEVTDEIDGVIEIVWDEETEELEVIFETNKTNLREIERELSKAGFNTPNFPASPDAVDDLPAECKKLQQEELSMEPKN